MPAFLIRNIPVKTKKAIQKRAKRHGNSTEAELRLIVAEAAKPEAAPAPQPAPLPRVGFGDQLREIALKHGVSFPDFVRDKRPLETFNFD
jgi:plasmid stability protein